MSSLVDFYLESTRDYSITLVGAVTGVGQSFIGTGQPITSAKFYLKKNNNPTADMYVKIYAHSGVFGISSIPTGSALATSNAINESTLTTSYQLIEFTFPTPYTPTAGTFYVVTIEGAGSGTDTVDVGIDISSVYHIGNNSDQSGGVWTAHVTYDTIFYLYTSAEPDIYYLTDTDITAGSVEEISTTAPSTIDTAQGWTVDKNSAKGAFYQPDAMVTSFILSQEPSGMGGTPGNYGYRTSATISKTFPAGNWQLNCRVKCNGYYAQKGKVYARLSKGSGTFAESTVFTPWTTVGEMSFSAANQYRVAGIVWSSVSEQVFSGEYLFLQIIWWCTATGGNNNAAVYWVHNDGSEKLITTYSSGPGAKIFAGTAQLTSVTPSPVFAITRPLAGTATLTSYTPNATLCLIKLFAGLASLLSVTSDATLSKLIGLAGTAQLTSVTPDAVLAVIRTLAGAAALTSATPDVILNVLRAMAGLAALASVTPDDIELTIGAGLTVIFAGTAALQTVTPDVILAVIRAMSGVASLESVTPAVTLAITRALSGIASLQTVTPDSVLSVIRTLAGAAVIQSLTPDAILSIIRAFAGTATITSLTPDAALSVFRALSGTAQLSSLTPDNIDLSIAGLIILAGVAAMQSNTPDAALAVTRCLSGLASLVSNTPDDVDLNLGEVVASILRLIRRRTC